MPLSPWRENPNGEPMSDPVSFRPVLSDSGGASPLCLLSNGLGSKVSTCEGPPFMKRKMTRFALGAKCGAFGASGLTAASARAGRADSSASTPASPRAPKPPPIRRSQSRRVQAVAILECPIAITPPGSELPDDRRSIHERKFIRPEQHLGVLLPSRRDRLRPPIGLPPDE